MSFILWINPGGDEVSKFQNDLQIQSDFTLASATSAKNICLKILMNEKVLYLLGLVLLGYLGTANINVT